MTYFFIDSHAHLNHPKMQYIDSVLQRARDNHIASIVNMCCNIEELDKAQVLQKKYPNIALAAALTPHDVIHPNAEEIFLYVQKMARTGSLAAIGETGLDYHYFSTTKDLQKKYFTDHVFLAKACKLPLVIHCREAFDDLFFLLDQIEGLPKIILHCFTGSDKEAKEALKRGFWISISGIVTYKNSKDLQEVVKNLPLDKLLIETDSPYLAPEKYRGKQNEPAFLPEVALKIAELKNLSIEEIAKRTSENAKKLFFEKIN